MMTSDKPLEPQKPAADHSRPSGPVSSTDLLALSLARLGYCGRSRYAPGTVGSAVAALIAPAVFLSLPLGGRLVLLAVMFALGSWAADRSEKVLGLKDPGGVVIDELVGQWLTYLPFATLGWGGIALGFVCFRVFDITKPFPIHRSEFWLRGGLGVMIDDCIAAVYAMATLWLLLRLFGM